MSRATRILPSVVASIVVSGMLVGAANAAPLDHFALDSYHAGKHKFTPPATSSVKLKTGLYVATVHGTFSYYGAINYMVPQAPWTIVCGTPEAAPELSSAGGSGQVGFDSEFIFARPWLPEPCTSAKLPAKWVNFQMNDGASGWIHPAVLGLATPPAPSPSHTYEYAVPAPGKHHVRFRLYDINTRDNYGSLAISLRSATPTDCAGTNYTAFLTSSEAECVADTGSAAPTRAG
jgi:hypothetical protein